MDYAQVKTNMQAHLTKTEEALKRDFAGLRTGRATTALLDGVMVEAYGATVPLNQVGNASVPEARMLSVQVWDRNLMKAVEKGLKGDAAAHTRALLAEKQPLEVVDEALIPALDIVGAKYEKGTLFLPQLLQAASAAQSAFEEIKTAIAQKGEGSASKGRIVLATVKGDVHDIGKNIVRVILENYGFEVLDLGRDVPVETVVETVREKDVHLVGLSALMTTTLKSMEETIAALHAAQLDCKIMVGGAVLTPEYAEKIGADWYAKDAKRSADIAKEFFGV